MKTNFLAADPSWLTGMARLGDLYGVFDSYNKSVNESMADSRGLFSDWSMVGQDLLVAAARFAEENGLEPPVSE